jgi:hypothetical protein
MGGLVMVSTLSRLVAVLALCFAGLVATPQAASAAGCSGGGCTGRDPQVQGCAADAYTAAEYTTSIPSEMGYNFGILRVELRHSNACRARWVRITYSKSDWGCGGGWGLRGRIRDFTAGGAQLSLQSADQPGGCPVQWWTPMVGRVSTSHHVQFCNMSIVNGNPTTDICQNKTWP